MRVALGMRVRTGRVTVVALTEAGAFVSRHQLLIYDEPMPPYHVALEHPERAAEIIARGEAAARRLALVELKKVLATCGEVLGAGVVVSSLTDPTRVKSAHIHAHSAESKLFYDAVIEALDACGVKHQTWVEAAMLKKAPRPLVKEAGDLKKAAGAPWTALEKSAAIAALFTRERRA